MKGDLTKEAQCAVVWEANKVEQFHPTTELLLLRGELSAGKISTFRF